MPGNRPDFLNPAICDQVYTLGVGLLDSSWLRLHGLGTGRTFIPLILARPA